MAYFTYTKEELQALMDRDETLASAIQQIGELKREIIPTIYHALVHTIIGQQIATKAHQTIWQRFLETFGDFTPTDISMASMDTIQAVGITYRKVTYIKELSKAIIDGTLDIESLALKSDTEVCKELVKLKGFGVWSAEMVMLHAMQRKNILSYDDLAIQRGLRILYQKSHISKEEFEEYRQLYTPYGSIASLYLWKIATGILPNMSDPRKEK